MATAPRKTGPRATTKDWVAAPDPTPPSPAWTPVAAPPPAPAAPAGTFDERTYTTFLHLSSIASALVLGLGFLGPLIMWVIKKDQSPFVDRHGRAALNFHISLFIYTVVLVVVIVFLFITIIGILLAIPLIIFGAIFGLVAYILFPILACLKANQGQEYRYPLAITFLRER